MFKIRVFIKFYLLDQLIDLNILSPLVEIIRMIIRTALFLIYYYLFEYIKWSCNFYLLHTKRIVISEKVSYYEKAI